MRKMALLVWVISILLISCKERKKAGTEDSTKAVSEQKIKAASEDYITAWNNNDIDLMKSITVTDLIRNANGEVTSHNQIEIAETMKFWHTAMPDFQIKKGDVIVKDNKSYSDWTSTGINTGMFGESPPTGKKSKARGFTILTFNKEGKITHEEAFYDLLGVIQSWGYTVTPPIME